MRRFFGGSVFEAVPRFLSDRAARHARSGVTPRAVLRAISGSGQDSAVLSVQFMASLPPVPPVPYRGLDQAAISSGLSVC